MLKMALIAYVNSMKAIWSAIAHPLSIISKKATILKDYRIYGNSVQDGEPTPENPIEVQSVGELTKNLYDAQTYPMTKGCYVYTVTGNIIEGWEQYASTVDYMPCAELRGKTITLNHTGGNTPGISFYSDKKEQILGVPNSNKTSVTATVPDEAFYYRFSVKVEYADEAMVVEGDTPAEFEPYHKYKVPVTVRGKNLFKYLTGQWANITLVEALASGDIVAGNSASDHVNSYASGWYRPGNTNIGGICPILHTGDIVTVSADITLIELRRDTEYKPSIYVFSQEANNGHTSNGTTPINVGETVRISRTYTIAEKYDGDAFYPIIPVNGNVVKIENIQIAYGTDSQYEPYIEPQVHNIYLDEPLRKVGDYADVVDFEKGVVVRNVKNKIFTGDNDGLGTAGFSSASNLYRYAVSMSDMPNLYNEAILASNYFPAGTYRDLDNTPTPSVGIFSTSRIAFSSPIATLSEFQNWIKDLYASNPLYVYYPLTNSVEEPISLPMLPQFKGTTVYEVQQDIPPSGIEACYYE
jgi:hypothetical protein